MLVLSRRLREKLLFPSINASVQVISVKAGVVKLGIDAPPEVAVLRHELVDGAAALPREHLAMRKARELSHAIRNRLNAASIGIALLRRQLMTEMTEASKETLEKLDRELGSLRQHLETGLPQSRAPVGARQQSRCRKALLVEDDHNERELLAGFLRMAGLEVATAGDGSDALDYLRGHGTADVVLLDMVLPRCDGPTTVRAIRRDPTLAGLKIFGVSGHALEHFGLERGPAGLDRWFQKPLNPETLLQDLQEEFAGAR